MTREELFLRNLPGRGRELWRLSIHSGARERLEGSWHGGHATQRCPAMIPSPLRLKAPFDEPGLCSL